MDLSRQKQPQDIFTKSCCHFKNSTFIFLGEQGRWLFYILTDLKMNLSKQKESQESFTKSYCHFKNSMFSFLDKIDLISKGADIKDLSGQKEIFTKSRCYLKNSTFASLNRIVDLINSIIYKVSRNRQCKQQRV